MNVIKTNMDKAEKKRNKGEKKGRVKISKNSLHRVDDDLIPGHGSTAIGYPFQIGGRINFS